ncbi:hypothetical protein BD779DRAFT_615553 [Infundibulicybe gibba]|nr:hypothetical protein BD779DRAFT_615553 [Infundibulicybe gibba]
MIPYGLKIAWFALSLSGLLGCWVIFLSVSRVVGSYWGPMLYCVGCTVFEGVFCLGLIWRMNPSLMPPGFCTAQTILISFANLFMTGVVMSFSLGTTRTVFKPKTWGHDCKSFLAWRNIYLIPLAVLPIIGSIVYVSILVKYHAAQPSEDMHCDATHPIWVRFFSYAGTPLLLALPCLYLSFKSIIRTIKTNRHLHRSRPSQSNRNFKGNSLTQRTLRSQSRLSHPTRKMLARIPREFQSTPKRMPPRLASLSSCPSLGSETEGQPSIPSPVSSSFPTFANPSDPRIPLPPNKEEPPDSNYPPIPKDSSVQRRQESQDSSLSEDNDKVSALEWREGSNTPRAASQVRFDKVNEGENGVLAGDYNSDAESQNTPTPFDGIFWFCYLQSMFNYHEYQGFHTNLRSLSLRVYHLSFGGWYYFSLHFQ